MAPALALSIDADGPVQVAAPSREVHPDRLAIAPLRPALFIDPGGPAATRVIDHGPLHVRLESISEATFSSWAAARCSW